MKKILLTLVVIVGINGNAQVGINALNPSKDVSIGDDNTGLESNTNGELSIVTGDVDRIQLKDATTGINATPQPTKALTIDANNDFIKLRSLGQQTSNNASLLTYENGSVKRKPLDLISGAGQILRVPFSNANFSFSGTEPVEFLPNASDVAGVANVIETIYDESSMTEIVLFDGTDANTGSNFTPNTQNSTTALYISNNNRSRWIYNGTDYAQRTTAITSNEIQNLPAGLYKITLKVSAAFKDVNNNNAIDAVLKVNGVTQTTYEGVVTAMRAENPYAERYGNNPSDAIKLYFKNDGGFASPHAYFFNVVGSGYTDPGWPGNAMTDEGDGWWSYTLPTTVTSVSAIFNNNNMGQQTGNLDGITLSNNNDESRLWYVWAGGGQTNGWQAFSDNGNAATGYFVDFLDLSTTSNISFDLVADGTAWLVDEANGKYSNVLMIERFK